MGGSSSTHQTNQDCTENSNQATGRNETAWETGEQNINIVVWIEDNAKSGISEHNNEYFFSIKYNFYRFLKNNSASWS